jgi:hypothetical protein
MNSLPIARPIGEFAMRLFTAILLFSLAISSPVLVAPVRGAPGDDEFAELLERLRKDNPGEHDKVLELAKTDRPAALRFLRERYRTKGDKPNPATKPEADASKPLRGIDKPAVALLPARQERFAVIETLQAGDFSIDLCRRDDGAFGLGEVRKGKLALRRADSLVTWQVDGKYPVYEGRKESTISLRDPPATLTIVPEKRELAGTTFVGLRMRFQCERGPIVETATWELGGTTRGLSYFDGYRGWHAPPQWQSANSVPETNPKLVPSLLAGTGFQFQHGKEGALVHFHTHGGGQLKNVSRGDALDFVSTFHGPATVDQFLFVTPAGSRIDLWTRAYEMVHTELRRAFDLPQRSREIFLHWPPFSRKGFRETAQECAAVTAREGFAGASIDVIWDNSDFHGGAKNMNVWEYAICDGYGGAKGLRALIDECKRHKLLVIAWAPAGHLTTASPVWKQHPDWLLKNPRGETFKNPSGLYHGALDTGFRDYFRDKLVGVVREFGLDGLWMDTHLSYAQQSRPADHSVRLAALYQDFVKAGAAQLSVEGDASAFGSYGIAIGDDWLKEWGKVPDPELYYGSRMQCGSVDPQFWRTHFRRYVAAGAAWVVDWDFLFSAKLTGDEFDAARREVREVVQDYRRVKDRMVHRFVHEDGSGYTWTNDKDGTKVVWLLKDARLPDGRRAEAGKVYRVD